MVDFLAKEHMSASHTKFVRDTYFHSTKSVHLLGDSSHKVRNDKLKYVLLFLCLKIFSSLCGEIPRRLALSEWRGMVQNDKQTKNLNLKKLFFCQKSIYQDITTQIRKNMKAQ